MGLTQAIYDRLSGDATLTGLLATYQTQPAIFSTDPIPEDATLPAVVISGVESDEPNDTKDRQGRRVERRIRFYTDATGSEQLVTTIAERGRALLHRQVLDLTGDGTSNYITDVSGPEIAPTDPDLYGRALIARFFTLDLP